MKYLLMLMLLFPVFAYAESNMKDEVGKTMTKMLELIEKQDHQTLLNTYVYVPDGQKKPQSIPLKKLDNVKMALTIAKNLTPTFSENDMIATYESDQFPRPLRFKKIDGIWKMMNN